MPIWTDCGYGLEKSPMDRIDHPAAAFLCCPGPSLADVTQDLRGPGRVIYAVNSAYPKIKPDVWVGLDRMACHHAHVWYEPFVKVTRYVKGDTARAHACPNLHYADLENGPMIGMFQRRHPETKFLWEHSTFLFALHFLYWLGHKRVYFVGSDHGGGTDYHDDRVLSDERRASNERLHDRQLLAIAKLAPIALRNGVEWVSCTPGSRLNQYLPYVPLPEAVKECERDLPPVEPLLHSVDADAMANGPKRAGEAFQTLLDQFDFATVLDVGAGATLDHARRFVQQGKTVTAMDHQVPSVPLGGVTVLQTDLEEDWPVAAESFDCVWSSHVLEHQRNPGRFIERMLSALKTNGILALTVPPMTQRIVGGHVSLWNAGLLCYHLVLAGLDLRGAVILESPNNISVIARKVMFDPKELGLACDRGDIEKLAPYFPTPDLKQGFDGQRLANV